MLLSEKNGNISKNNTTVNVIFFSMEMSSTPIKSSKIGNNKNTAAKNYACSVTSSQKQQVSFKILFIPETMQAVFSILI